MRLRFFDVRILKAAAWKRARLVESLTICLFAYISLIPFYYLQPLDPTSTLPSFSLLKYLPFIFVVFIALTWIYDVWKSERQVVRTAIDPFVAVYLGIGLLSLIKTAYPAIGLSKWVYYTTTGVLLCYLLMQYLSSWAVIWRLMRGLCIVCGITACYTLFCHFLDRDYLWEEVQRQFNPYYHGNQRATGPFGNAVFAGAYLSLCFPFTLWILTYTEGLRKRLFYGILSGTVLMTLAVSQSRGGWLAAGIALIVIVIVFLRRMWIRLCRDQKCAALVMVIAAFPVVIGIMQGMGLARVFEREIIDMAYRVELTSPSLFKLSEAFRIAQYRATFHVLKAHPFLGVGFGNFTRVYDTYKDPSTPPGYPARTPENMYLMFAAETGWLGLSAAVALLWAIFYTIYRAYFRIGESARRNLLLTFLAGGGGFLVNMGTWDALNEPVVRMTFWILVGVALAAAKRDLTP